MPLSSRSLYSVPLPLIHAAWLNAAGQGLIPRQGTAAASTYPAANRAVFVPVEIERTVTIVAVGVFNAGVSGNIDLGIYREDGSRVASTGSIAQSGASTIQTASLSATLTPGVYFMAVSRDNITTGGFFAWAPDLAFAEAICAQQMDSAFPLPSTATFANQTTGFVPEMWLMMQSTI